MHSLAHPCNQLVQLEALGTAAGVSSTSIRAAWDPPRRDNGSPVTAYHVEYCGAPTRSRAAAHSWRTCPMDAAERPAEACLIRGLRQGRNYLVRVRAANARGPSAWSIPAEAETLPGPPGPPEAPTFSHRTATSVRVRWQPPLEDNGAPVHNYRHASLSIGAPPS